MHRLTCSSRRLMGWLLTIYGLGHFAFNLATGCECGGVLKEGRDTIISPRYPDRYPPNCNCKWQVQIDRAVIDVVIRFKHFALEPMRHGVCADYVKIGTEMYCGNSAPPDMHLQYQSFTVIFKSDEGEGFEGFKLEYEATYQDASVSQATAGIVAAVFCAVVFMGIGALRCILKGPAACQPQDPQRECIDLPDGDYEMDCPPTYRTVMEHPERYPTPTLSPQPTPSGTPRSTRAHSRLSRAGSGTMISSDEDDDDPPPPYPGVVVQLHDELRRPNLATDSGSMGLPVVANLDIEPQGGHEGSRGQTGSESDRHGGTANEPAQCNASAVQVLTSCAVSDGTGTAVGRETGSTGGESA